jgi:MFS family permease
MGTWMQSVAQGWLVYELTGSKLALGTISFAGSIPTLFLLLPAGAVADRIPRRRLMMMTQSAMMVLAFILALLAATRTLQVWHIAVLAFMLGVANSFDAPARQSLAVEMVEDRRDLQNAIALNSTMFNLARVVGPAIGGFVLAELGATWCFALNGLSFVAVLIALLGMRLPDAVNASRTERLTAQIGTGLRYVWGHAEVRAIIALVGISTLFGFSYSVLLPAYAADVLHVGEAGLGGLNAAVGVGALIGALTVATLSRSRYKGWQLAAGSFLFPLGLLSFAFSRSFSLSLVCLALVGFGFVSQNATSNTLVQGIVPDELRGRVMGVYSLMFFGTTPFGSLLAGSLAQAFGPTIGVIVGAGVTLVFALIVFIFVPSLRRHDDKVTG